MLKSPHLVREKMTEAARRNRFWNYESPNCCGLLNNIHRTEGKWWRKTALSTSPRKLIVGEERGHPQRVKRVSRICQAADCSDSGAQASDRTSSNAWSRKKGLGLHDNLITEVELRVRPVMLPHCPIPFFLIINLKTAASSFLADAVVSAH
jgi:hypothetical protein